MTRTRRSNTSGPGYARIRAGSGFTYRDPSGTTVTDSDLRCRFDDLVSPPAWTDVWISPYENGHILATGVDAAGRRQYIYHPSWRARMDRIKYDRALALAESLPSARRLVTIDLRRPDTDRQRALAAAFRMLDQGSLRVGSERYAIEHGSHGLATLVCAHAHVSGDHIELDFPAKSGHEWSSTIHVHDLARSGAQPTAPKRARAVTRAVKAAGEVLGNTPSVARTSYVDPRSSPAMANAAIASTATNAAVPAHPSTLKKVPPSQPKRLDPA
jgi:DNA topoisomerase-1